MKGKKAKARKATQARYHSELQRRSAAADSDSSALTDPQTHIDWSTFLRVIAIFCLIGAGIVHGLWVEPHLEEWTSAGVFFILLAVIQTLGAFALMFLPGRPAYLAIVIVNVGTILVWAVSRTVGMPIGPEAGDPEAVGLPDLVAGFFELLSVLALLPLLLQLTKPGRRAPRTGGMPSQAYAALSGIAVCALVLTGVAVVPATMGGNGLAQAGDGSGYHVDQQLHNQASASAAPSPSGTPQGTHAPVAAEIDITANVSAFDTRTARLPAGKRVAVNFHNNDTTVHNFAIFKDPRFRKRVFTGKPVNAGEQTRYEFKAPKSGRYYFRCDIHPFMRGAIIFEKKK